MADQTVDFFHVGKVKGVILPSITGMAFGATAPIRFNGDSVVVHQVDFPEVGVGFMIFEKRCFSLPHPMGGVHEFCGCFFMAFQAGSGDIFAGYALGFNELGMVHTGMRCGTSRNDKDS